MSKRLDSVLYVCIALAVILSLFNVSMIMGRIDKINEAKVLAAQGNIPAKLELIKITATSCSNCYDIDLVIADLKKSNVNITSEKVFDLSSAEAKPLIEKYNIEKFPTVIVSGEVNKSSWNQNWKVGMENDVPSSYVYTSLSPPYVDNTGKTHGIVSFTHIVDSSCSQCVNLSQVISFFEQNKVIFSDTKTLDYSSSEAKGLLLRYDAQKVPALIISKDILEYSAIAQVWDQLNATEKDGFYTIHSTIPPYRNIKTNNIEGLVSVIYLNDTSCTECYNVQVNKVILESNFGLTLANETEMDVSSVSGKALIKKYNITKVPVILVSSDATAYGGFSLIWPQVGDVASDGWYVMRSPEVLGTYKDLSTGQVVAPAVQQQSGG